jgi:hypothetical protein
MRDDACKNSTTIGRIESQEAAAAQHTVHSRKRNKNAMLAVQKLKMPVGNAEMSPLKRKLAARDCVDVEALRTLPLPDKEGSTRFPGGGEANAKVAPGAWGWTWTDPMTTRSIRVQAGDGGMTIYLGSG